jgi:hypothetical protein
MEPTEEMGYPRWNLLKSWLDYLGWNPHCNHIHPASIGLPLNGVYREIGCPGWNLLESWAASDGIHTVAIYMLLFLLGCPQDGVHRGDGPSWMEWAFAEDIATVHFLIFTCICTGQVIFGLLNSCTLFTNA